MCWPDQPKPLFALIWVKITSATHAAHSPFISDPVQTQVTRQLFLLLSLFLPGMGHGPERWGFRGPDKFQSFAAAQVNPDTCCRFQVATLDWLLALLPCDMK